MKLVDLYKREYEPKYQYPDNWHLSISPTDRHTFSIENKNTKDRLCYSSEKSFLEAEEVVYKRYQKYLECDHDWRRWLPHANYGICNHCKAMQNDMYESLHDCKIKGCEKKGEINSMNGYFCATHFMEDIVKEKDEYLQLSSEELEGKDNHNTYLTVLEGEIFDFIKNNSEEFENLIEKEKLEFIKKIGRSLGKLVGYTLNEINDTEEQITVGVCWTFQYFIKLDKIKDVAYSFFKLNYIWEKDNPSKLAEELYALSLEEVDYEYHKELLKFSFKRRKKVD
ncbi:MAG: hypothetical protein CL760_10545 [Chloroflexi bacterium]|nr:hypothetical protein [Chloroflexota bacterium]